MYKIKKIDDKFKNNILKLSYTVKRLVLYTSFTFKNKQIDIEKIEKDIYIIKSCINDIENIILNTKK